MSHFELNPDFEHDIVRTPEMKENLTVLGEKVLARARALAAEHVKTGEYLKSLKGELNESETHRPYYRVASDHKGAASIEFGDVDQREQRILGRAIGENLEEL